MATPTAPLSPWESFYVIVGSAAAALTGLQFVVIVLGAEMQALRNETATRAFGTPTVVHFCMALFIAAVLSAPWETLHGPGIVLSGCGIGGFVYVIRILWHARRQTSYKPVLEDWIWYFILPFLTYASLAIAALGLEHKPPTCLFVIAGVVLTLVFIGIHNAWDTVTYLAVAPQQNTTQTHDTEKEKAQG